MKFEVKNYFGNTQISLNHQTTGKQQLFYGPVYRGFNLMKGYYDHTNKNIWPKVNSWENEYIDNFMEYCENGSFIGIYLLWFIVHLSIVTPKVKTSTMCIWNGKPQVSFEYNITVDWYNIEIRTRCTECKDATKIIFEVSKELENFNIDNVFNEMVQTYKDLYFKTFENNQSKKLFEISHLPLKKEVKKKDESLARPSWKNKIPSFEKTLPHKKILDVFNKEFEENKISFYTQLL